MKRNKVNIMKKIATLIALTMLFGMMIMPLGTMNVEATETNPVDPVITNFKIEIDGCGAGNPSSVGLSHIDSTGARLWTSLAATVSGGDSEVEVITYKNAFIILENCYIDSSMFKDSMSGSIIAMDDNGDEVGRWTFEEAWPCNGEGQNTNGSGNGGWTFDKGWPCNGEEPVPDTSAEGEHLMEKVTIVIEKIERT